MDKDTFKILRKNYKLTQAQMGAALVPSASRQAIIDWERGHHPLPADIVERCARGNLAAPSQKDASSKLVTEITAPQCYRADPTRRGYFNRTLAHPKWWYGSKSPFARLCSFEDWQAIDGKSTMQDLGAYVAPTPRQAFDLMLARGIADADAHKYLATMGSPLPGYIEPARLTNDTTNFPNEEWK
jgi:transcriptional regulator with XRE-family HTH domain